MAGGQRLRFIVMGAGMAGILSAIRLKQAGYDFVVYEKADRPGGTWRENTYPGLTCDVPSHAYTYSFAPNPDWSRHLPPGPEIYAYFENTARRFGVWDRMHFGQEVTRAVWADGRWRIETGGGMTDEGDVVIAATGILHHPSYPDIEGLASFRGAGFHSARWDHSVPLDGRRIGVIGNGSSGVQMVSALAARAGRLSHFTRTPQWINPVQNGVFTEEQKAMWRADPGLLTALQNDETYLATAKAFSDGVVDAESPAMQAIAARCLQNLEDSVRDPVLREKLRPNYRAVCKRLISSPDYYEAIQHPNAELVTERILKVEPEGVRTEDGRLHPLDMLVLATGFKVDRFMRPMEMVGKGGARLDDVWARRPGAYLSIAMPDFPNLFMINGPSSPVGNFSLIDVAEREIDYILKMAALLSDGRCGEITVTRAAYEDYESRRVEAAKGTIWASGCRSWYLDAEGVPATWPWTYTAFGEAMATPRLEDYAIAA
jgi:cation diffusion facilitator CzcD-associated flavoprotein CzcO